MSILFNIALDVAYEASKLAVKGLYYAASSGYYYMYPYIDQEQENRKSMLEEIKKMQADQAQIIEQNQRLLDDNRKLAETNKVLMLKVDDDSSHAVG